MTTNPREDGPQPILIAGAEGGGLTLYGKRNERGWQFSLTFVDQSPFMLAEASEQREICRQTGVTENWDEALAFLDEQRWLRLPPVMVHREFRQRIWDAVKKRLRTDLANVNKLAQWQHRCGIS